MPKQGLYFSKDHTKHITKNEHGAFVVSIYTDDPESIAFTDVELLAARQYIESNRSVLPNSSRAKVAG